MEDMISLYTVEIASGGVNEWIPDYRYTPIACAVDGDEADTIISQWKSEGHAPNWRIRKTWTAYRPAHLYRFRKYATR